LQPIWLGTTTCPLSPRSIDEVLSPTRSAVTCLPRWQDIARLEDGGQVHLLLGKGSKPRHHLGQHRRAGDL